MVFETRRRATKLGVSTASQWGFGEAPTVYQLPPISSKVTTGYWGPNNFRSMDRFEEKPGMAYLKAFDWGHDFESTSMRIDESSLRYYDLTNTQPFNNGYRGYILPQSYNEMEKNLLVEPTLAELRTTMMAVGTTAVKRTMPNQSAVDLGQTLGELRADGLPRLPNLMKLRNLSEGYTPKSAASDYLNYEFSWKPLVSDIIGILGVVKESERILEQYRRDSGRQIRRRYEFPTEVTTETKREGSKKTYPFPAVSYYNCYTGNGSDRYLGELVQTVQRTTRTWFSGAYRYHIPNYTGLAGDISRWVREADLLLGLAPDPDLVWNLTKWSWLVDWFVNFGDILANVSSLGKDNLVMRYGYIMRQTTQKIDSTLVGFNPMHEGRILPSPSMTHYWERKVRYHASPYGFGLDPGVFTPRQWAILAALGISNAPGKMFG